MRIVTFVLLVLVVVPAWASEPGQPLSIEDWVLVLPGLSAEPVVQWESQCYRPADILTCPSLGSLYAGGASADGSGYYAVSEVGPALCSELPSGHTCFRHEIRRFTPHDQTEIVAYIEERLGSPVGTIDAIQSPEVIIDGTNGFLYLSWSPACHGVGCAYPSNYSAIWRIRGLATTFEVLQTYTPVSGPISFRVPYMPEGFQYADYFDTYWGDIATVGDWSQAQPLQCGYPATAPSVGDYLTVEDTLPTPAPGRGYYFVTAVNYQGQRRYGRQSNGDVLTGRDPTALPECVE